MNFVSALDLAKIPYHPVDEWTRTHSCPWCNSIAWSGSHHMQCMNQACAAQTANGLDVLVKATGSNYIQADAAMAAQIGHKPNPAAARRRHVERLVLDRWISICREPRSILEMREESKWTSLGLNLDCCVFSGTVVGGTRLASLIKLAQVSGADISDGLLNNPPASAFVYCVQSAPHTIDRLVVMQRGRDQDIVWHEKKAGFSGLIGLPLEGGKLLASDRMEAMRLQAMLKRVGRIAEVASAFVDRRSATDVGMWSIDRPQFTAIISSKDDVITIDRTLNAFRGMDRLVPCLSESSLMNPHAAPGEWNRTRRAFIKGLTPQGSHRLTADTVSLFELTGSRADDALWVMRAFLIDGHPHLAEDFKRLAENRVIARERNYVVREAINEYQTSGVDGESVVANFVIRPKSMVLFKERSGEVYYRSSLHYGNKVSEVLISQASFESPKDLKDELIARVVTDSTAAESLIVPTVVDVPVMKNKVLPYLRAQIARLPSSDGISNLGWNMHRTAFITPGRIVGLDGTHTVDPAFHPALPTLRLFRAVDTWSESYPADVHGDCQAVISIMLALSVRYYKRFNMRPASVRQTSESSRIVSGLAAALGQVHIHEMGHNHRERSDAEGIRGYPFVSSGFGQGQLLQTSVPYIILTDRGVELPGNVDEAQLEQAGRALQCALLRVAGWCLATGADDFRESKSADYNVSLMEEGRWLIENVCQLQSWEARSSDMPMLEVVLGRIPTTDTIGHLTLVDGLRLKFSADAVGDTKDALIEECAKLGWEPELSPGGDVSVLAAAVMPSVCSYFGRQPEMATEDAAAECADVISA